MLGENSLLLVIACCRRMKWKVRAPLLLELTEKEIPGWGADSQSYKTWWRVRSEWAGRANEPDDGDLPSVNMSWWYIHNSGF